MSRAERPQADLTAPEAQPFFFQGDGTAILLVHGFTGSAAHMRPLGEALAGEGRTVMGINLPGHGTKPEDMGACNRHTWLAAVTAAVAQLRTHAETVVVAGLSLGGVLALLAAERGLVDGVCTISTPMDMAKAPAGVLLLAKPLSWVKPNFAWKADPQRADALDQRYDLGYSTFPTKAAAQLGLAMLTANRHLPDVHCPALVVQSRKDATVSKESLDVIAAGVDGKAETLWLEDAPHVCTLSA